MRLGPVARRVGPVGARLRTVLGRPGPLGRGERTVALGTGEDLLTARGRIVSLIVQPGKLITTLRATITKLGDLVSVVARSTPRAGIRVARLRGDVTLAARVLACELAAPKRVRIPARREPLPGGLLIHIRAAPVVIACRLVTI